MASVCSTQPMLKCTVYRSLACLAGLVIWTIRTGAAIVAMCVCGTYNSEGWIPAGRPTVSRLPAVSWLCPSTRWSRPIWWQGPLVVSSLWTFSGELALDI